MALFLCVKMCLLVGVSVRVILWCVIAKLFLYGKDNYWWKAFHYFGYLG